MIKLKSITPWLLVILLAITSISCDKDPVDDNNNNNNTKEDPSGSLHVYVRLKGPSGIYVGWAPVKLYETKEARAKGYAAYDSNYTDGFLPYAAGFYKLPLKKFYIRAFYENQGNYYQGDGEIQIVLNDTLHTHIAVYE